MEKYDSKIEKLAAILNGYGKVAVAFSGGSDSLFLLYMAFSVLGKSNVVACTAKSAFFSEYEEKQARDFTEFYGISHVFVDIEMDEVPEFIENDTRRCYFCKQNIATKFIACAEEKNFSVLTEGTNADDLNDIREGFKAVVENGINSPLLEAGFTKADIAKFLKEHNMLRWLRPSSACLASRVPYGITITKEILQKVEKAEDFLRSLGVSQVRLRHHGDTARIELLQKDMDVFISEQTREKTVGFIKKLGYRYVTLDLGGFVSGSLNK